MAVRVLTNNNFHIRGMIQGSRCIKSLGSIVPSGETASWLGESWFCSYAPWRSFVNKLQYKYQFEAYMYWPMLVTE